MILNLVAVIVDRSRAKLTAELFESHKLPMVLAMLARGTATSEVLDLYGLEATDKTLLVTVAGGDMTHQLMRAAKRKLFIDVPGNGIMLAIPIKSVGGGRTLAFISGGAAPDSSAPELKFEHELIMAVINEGHTDPVMDAARSAGGCRRHSAAREGHRRKAQRKVSGRLSRGREGSRPDCLQIR